MIKLFFACALSMVLLFNKCNRSKDTPTAQEKPEHVSVKPGEEPPVNQEGEGEIEAKSDTGTSETLRKLYDKYKNGEIEACRYNGATVYKAGLNAPDAGSVIFDASGNKIGSCNYGWGKPDAMCEELKECQDVYRVANNIWGKPAVDIYGLAR